MSRPIKNHIGISGGKDSTALLLWAVHESGYDPETLDFTFCDTDNENDATYDFVVRLSEHLAECGLPKIKWLKPVRGYFDMVKHEGRFPSPQVRFCTRLLKIVPTQAHIKKLVAEGFDLVLHSGIRADESEERAKMVAREDVMPHVSEFRPLLKWKIEDVWAIHKRYGIEPNPLYAKGATRVGCFPCMMSRKHEIAAAAEIDPEKFDKIRANEGPNKNGRSWNTFFEYKKTPLRFRSHISIKKDGTKIAIPLIDDVLRWAREKAHFQPSLLPDLDTTAEDRTSCQSTWGSCE